MTNDNNHPNNDIWQVTLNFQYDILLAIHFLGYGDQMRYQESQRNESKALENILPVVNFILFLVIAIGFNYLVINFLF